jgi:hypothetical protein
MEFPCFLWKFHVPKNGSCVERCQNGAFLVHTDPLFTPVHIWEREHSNAIHDSFHEYYKLYSRFIAVEQQARRVQSVTLMETTPSPWECSFHTCYSLRFVMFMETG